MKCRELLETLQRLIEAVLEVLAALFRYEMRGPRWHHFFMACTADKAGVRFGVLVLGAGAGLGGQGGLRAHQWLSQGHLFLHTLGILQAWRRSQHSCGHHSTVCFCSSHCQSRAGLQGRLCRCWGSCFMSLTTAAFLSCHQQFLLPSLTYCTCHKTKEVVAGGRFGGCLGRLHVPAPGEGWGTLWQLTLLLGGAMEGHVPSMAGTEVEGQIWAPWGSSRLSLLLLAGILHSCYLPLSLP